MSPQFVPGYRRSRRPRNPASRNGTGHLPFANRAGCKHARDLILTRMGYKQAGPFRWGELVKCDELIQVLAAWAARGPLGGEWPDVLGGKARRIYVLVSQRRAGRDPGRHTRPGAPSPRIEIRPKQQTGKREQPDNTRSSVNVSRSGGVAGR